MKIAILGAGFTGLTAALRLSQKGHEVTVFEKEDVPGGLASGFKGEKWNWYLEKAYHHFFTNDKFALDLAREVNQEILIQRPLTAIYYNPESEYCSSEVPSEVEGRSRELLDSPPTATQLRAGHSKNSSQFSVQSSKFVYPFDSPFHLLLFPYLSISQKIRTGLVLAFLKTTNNYNSLEKHTAYEWLEKYMGKTAFNILFKPLFIGKFGNYAKTISMAWFWARIKKRTPSLAYPVGGYQSFIDKLIQKIGSAGGKVFLNDPVNEIQKEDNSKFKIACPEQNRGENSKFDAVISTLPTPAFLRLTQSINIPSNYIKRLTNISHFHALNLILELKEPFFLNNKVGDASRGAPTRAQDFTPSTWWDWRATGPTSHNERGHRTRRAPDRIHTPIIQPYWLNINDPSFPFLALVEHTNFMDKKHYNNHHLLYIGNYLPQNHEYFTKSKEELLQIFDPYLKIFNSNYSQFLVQSSLFASAYAQPITITNYAPPPLETGVKNLYAGNLDNVYPWDRGTNYAIELGEKLANLINSHPERSREI